MPGYQSCCAFFLCYAKCLFFFLFIVAASIFFFTAGFCSSLPDMFLMNLILLNKIFEGKQTGQAWEIFSFRERGWFKSRDYYDPGGI